MAKSLNKVTLIGNLTRDPELRFTPQGSAVCTFGMATNRQWTTDSGEKKESAEFHRIVAWNKLAEICSQLLKKGRKVYIEGRLQTRSWQAADGAQKSLPEVVISDMILLDSKMVSRGRISMFPRTIWMQFLGKLNNLKVHPKLNQKSRKNRKMSHLMKHQTIFLFNPTP